MSEEMVKDFSTGRWILLAGIILLAAGGAARWNGMTFAPVLFSAGGLCKISFIIISIKSGRYRPGYEILLLLTGLTLLACGIASRHYESPQSWSSALISAAVIFKLMFVVRFISLIRKD